MTRRRPPRRRAFYGWLCGSSGDKRPAKHLGTFLGIAIALCLCASAPASASILRLEDECVRPAALAGYDRVTGDAGYELRAIPATRERARDVQDIIRRYDIWRTYAAALDPPDGDRSRTYPVYVVPAGELPSNVLGANARLCGDLHHSIVLIGDNPPRGQIELADVTAHELFHAFQNKPEDGEVNWWEEATAMWAEYTLVRDPYILDKSRRLMLVHRELALDHYRPNDPDVSISHHHYAAMAFVLWLEERFGRARTMSFLLHSFRGIQAGNHRSATWWVDAALGLEHEDLVDDLGRFWADEATIDQVPVPDDARTFGIGDPYDFYVQSPRLRATIEDLFAARSASDGTVISRQISYSTSGFQNGSGRLWAVYGGHKEDWTHGGSARFCVSPSGAGYPVDGVRLIAVGGTGEGGSTRTVIHVSESEEPCSSPGDDPGRNAMPLPSGCPGPPPAVAPRGRSEYPHTQFGAWLQRVETVQQDARTWERDISGLSASALRRRGFETKQHALAHNSRCLAARVSRLGSAPNRHFDTLAGDYVQALRAAAAHEADWGDAIVCASHDRHRCRGEADDAASAYFRSNGRAGILAARIEFEARYEDIERGCRPAGPHCAE